MPTYKYDCIKCGEFEIFHGITEDLKKCPTCGSKKLERIICWEGHFIDNNRQMNQFPEVKASKYWRDKDGNRHKVTPADGSLNSPTVSSKRKRTDEQAAAFVKADRARIERQKKLARINKSLRQK